MDASAGVRPHTTDWFRQGTALRVPGSAGRATLGVGIDADAAVLSGVKWRCEPLDGTGRWSSRWAGSISKGTHDQWALARRAHLAHIQTLEAAVRMIAHRLCLPVG